jgi:hypothetical protein
MTDVMGSLYVDVHPSEAKLTLLFNGNSVFIASTDSMYSFWQISVTGLADSTTSFELDALCDHHSLMFDIAFNEQ